MSNFPKTWTKIPLGQIGRWFGGGTPSKATPRFWTSGTIPWVSPKDMKSALISGAQDYITQEAVTHSATNLVTAGSVLIVVRSGILQHTLPVGVTQRDVALNQDLKAVKPRDDVRPDYLALALKAFEQEILRTCTKAGTTVQSLEFPTFLRFAIPVAPPDEQGRIVGEIEKQLTRLDAGTTALRHVQVKLKRLRAAVLQAACAGRLVATEAELARREDRSYETGAELLAHILVQRRQHCNGRGKYKDPADLNSVNLPFLTEGWTWVNLDQLASPDPNSITDGPFGSNLKTEHYTSKGPRVVRLQNIGDGVYTDEKAHITNARFELLRKHRIFSGDIVIAAFGANPPRSCIIPESLGPAIVKADCIRFKPHEMVIAGYINIALNSESTRVRTKGLVHGVGRPRLNLGEIKSIVIPLPPLAEQRRIFTEVERRLSVVAQLETAVTSNLRRATLLRQAILQRAFRGELA